MNEHESVTNDADMSAVNSCFGKHAAYCESLLFAGGLDKNNPNKETVRRHSNLFVSRKS